MSRYTLMDYFSIYVEEWDSLLEEFLRHLAMTSFSVVLALIIAVPLGIFITRNKAVSNVVIGIANVMQWRCSPWAFPFWAWVRRWPFSWYSSMRSFPF